MKTNHIVQNDYGSLVFKECKGMAIYAAERGMPVPVSVAKTITEYESYFQEKFQKNADGKKESQEENGPAIDQLISAHQLLSKIVEPSTPQAILLINKGDGRSIFDCFGPVPLIRDMIFVALFSLIIFIFVVLQKEVNLLEINIFTLDGKDLFFPILFLISASALGASFAALYKANQYIKNLTYDPNQVASYWIRFLLGIMSGLILSLVIDTKAIESKLLIENVVKPLLAILGGFSADLFYTFLNRMVESMKSLFEGSTKEIIDSQAQVLKLKSSKDLLNNKIVISTQLMELQKKISSNKDPEIIQQTIDNLWENLLPELKSPQV
jgi:hypothetical protein